MTELSFDKTGWMQDRDGVWLMLRVPNVREAQRVCEHYPDGKYSAELKERRNSRSLDANAYFHVLVGKIAGALSLGFEEVKTNLVTEYGAFARDEDGLKVGFKLPASVDVESIYRYVKQFDTREENGKTFNCYIVFKQTHLMDSKEFSRLIDGAVYEAKQLGIETMPPDELAALVSRWRC